MYLTIRPATLELAEWIGQRLRPEDELECMTSTGSPGSTVVPLSFQYSKECYVMYPEPRDRRKAPEHPAVIFGVCDDPANPDVGIVWLLATPEIQRCAISVIREAHHWLAHFTRLYPRGLYNYVDARNDLHVRWLKLTGFVMQGAIQRNGETFYYALRRNPDDTNV